MKKILIIGKNSYYYSKVRKDLAKIFFLTEISHKDVISNNIKEKENWHKVIIFSRSKNINFFEKIFENYSSNEYILLSSIILELPNNFKYYSYYNEKLRCEKWFFECAPNSSICSVIRSGTIQGSNPIYSTVKNFIDSIIKKSSRIRVLNVDQIPHKEPNFLYKFIFSFNYGYILLRPIDYIYKIQQNYIYGYVYAIKKFIVNSK